MNSDILHALQQFPTRRLAIQRRVLRDPEFRTLCSDYSVALVALAYWRNSETDASLRDARCREYETLVRELGQEIESSVER